VNIAFNIAIPKDVFMLKLAGEGLDFGLLSEDDYVAFMRKCIELNLVEFYGQKDYRGMLAQFRATDNFKFSMTDTGLGYRSRVVAVSKNDYIQFTEQMSANDYERDVLPMNIGVHKIFVDFDSELRVKMYRKYNLDA